MRTAARVMTRVYDAFLRDSGLKASQLALLAAADAAATVSIAELSKRLAMDRTTLSRNLNPLVSAGLIEVGDEGWRRSKFVRITEAGRARIALAVPLWEQAQADLFGRFGKKRWQETTALLQELGSRY
jgi:DNA-binding MarR family transcriptional regulator